MVGFPDVDSGHSCHLPSGTANKCTVEGAGPRVFLPCTGELRFFVTPSIKKKGFVAMMHDAQNV